jgi:hypothetical protein
LQYFEATFEAKAKKGVKTNYTEFIAKFGKLDERAGAVSVRATGELEEEASGDDDLSEEIGATVGTICTS